MDNFNEAEETEWTGVFGLHGVIAIRVSCDGVMHAGILERQRNGRDEVQKIEDIDGDENGGDARIERPSFRIEVLAGNELQKAEEKIKKREADRSADQEDKWPD